MGDACEPHRTLGLAGSDEVDVVLGFACCCHREILIHPAAAGTTFRLASRFHFAPPPMRALRDAQVAIADKSS